MALIRHAARRIARLCLSAVLVLGLSSAAVALRRTMALALLCTLAATPAVFAQPEANLGSTGLDVYYQDSPNEILFKAPAVERTETPEAFYDYYSASSHTGFEEIDLILFFLYRDVSSSVDDLSLFITMGKDTSSQGTWRVDMTITGVPDVATLGVSDDRGEFRKRSSGRWVGNWYGRGNTDGGIIKGIPTDSSWEICLSMSRHSGMRRFEYYFGDTGNQGISLTRPVCIGHTPGAGNNTLSSTRAGTELTICGFAYASTAMVDYTFEWNDPANPGAVLEGTIAPRSVVCFNYTYTTAGTFATRFVVTNNNGSSTASTIVSIVPNDADFTNIRFEFETLMVNADGGSDGLIKLTARDVYGNPVPGLAQNVTFQTDGGALTGDVEEATPGLYQQPIRGTGLAGPATITAAFNGEAIQDNATVIFVGEPDQARSSVEASIHLLPADGVSTSTVTVHLRDANAVSLLDGNDTVMLSSTIGTLTTLTSNDNGTHTALLRSTQPGIATVTAVVKGGRISDSAEVEFTALEEEDSTALGLIVAGLIIIALLLVLIFWWYMRKQSKKSVLPRRVSDTINRARALGRTGAGQTGNTEAGAGEEWQAPVQYQPKTISVRGSVPGHYMVRKPGRVKANL